MDAPRYKVNHYLDSVENSVYIANGQLPRILISGQSFIADYEGLRKVDGQDAGVDLSGATNRMELWGRPDGYAEEESVLLATGQYYDGSNGSDGKVLFTVEKDVLPNWGKYTKGRNTTPVALWFWFEGPELSYQVSHKVEIIDKDRIGEKDIPEDLTDIAYDANANADLVEQWRTVAGDGNFPGSQSAAIDKLAAAAASGGDVSTTKFAVRSAEYDLNYYDYPDWEFFEMDWGGDAEDWKKWFILRISGAYYLALYSYTTADGSFERSEEIPLEHGMTIFNTVDNRHYTYNQYTDALVVANNSDVDTNTAGVIDNAYKIANISKSTIRIAEYFLEDQTSFNSWSEFEVYYGGDAGTFESWYAVWIGSTPYLALYRNEWPNFTRLDAEIVQGGTPIYNNADRQHYSFDIDSNNWQLIEDTALANRVTAIESAVPTIYTDTVQITGPYTYSPPANQLRAEVRLYQDSTGYHEVDFSGIIFAPSHSTIVGKEPGQRSILCLTKLGTEWFCTGGVEVY